MPRLTKRTVDAATPDPVRRFTVWDSEIKGLGLLVLPSGVKSFVYDYRTKSGNRRRATIGKFGAITPDEARRKADAMRREVNGGGDPLADKRDRMRAPTVGDILDAYLGSEKFKSKADSTKATDRGRIERHLKPLLGKIKAEVLTPEQVMRTHAAIRDGKTAKREKMGFRALARVRGGDGAARKSIKLLAAVFRWAMKERLVASNPAAGAEVGSDGTRDAILESSEDYGRLFQALDRLEADRRIRSPVADAVRVIALTGARRGEIAGLRWCHVDLKNSTLSIDAHKTARSTGKPRIIALPAIAAAVVSRQPRGGPDDFVFAPAGGDGPLDLAHPWVTIRAEAGLPGTLGLHSLRHSLASHLAMSGAQASEIMTALGHRSIVTSAKYVHMAQDARRQIAERAAAVALAGMQGTEDGADVVPIKGRT